MSPRGNEGIRPWVMGIGVALVVGIAVWWRAHPALPAAEVPPAIVANLTPEPDIPSVTPPAAAFASSSSADVAVESAGELTEERLKGLLAERPRARRASGENLLYSQRMAALAQLGETIVPQLKSILQGSPEPAERQMAVQLLAHIGNAESMDFLLSYLEDLTDAKVAGALSRQLQCTESTQAGLPLVDALLRNPPDVLSEQIIGALGRIGDLSAAEKLIKLERDPDLTGGQRDLVLRALAAQESARVVPVLASRLNAPANADLRTSLADALAKIDNHAATQALLQVTEAEQADSTHDHPCWLALQRVQSEESAACLLSALQWTSAPHAATIARELIVQMPAAVIQAANGMLLQTEPGEPMP